MWLAIRSCMSLTSFPVRDTLSSSFTRNQGIDQV